jgi:hypothetical protein
MVFARNALAFGPGNAQKKEVIFHNLPFLFYLFGGAEGDRTPGLMNAIHALSQLSYSPTSQVLENNR